MKSLSIKRNILWNSAGALTYSGCQWLMTVLVVRLSPSYGAAGVLALAMAVSNIFSPIALYKIRAYQVSDIHEEVSSGEYIGLRFITIALAFAIVIPYAFITCSLSSLPSIILYLFFRAGESFIDVLHGIDQQHFRMDYCGRSLALRGVLFVSSFSIVLALTGILELSILAMILTTYPVIVCDLKNAHQFSSVKPVFSLSIAFRLLRQCLPAVIGMSVCNFVVTFARQFLGMVQGDAALGIYASICTPVVLIQACSHYVYAPLLGVFANYLDKGNIQGFRSLLTKVAGAFALIFGIGALAFLFAGKWFLSFVFGTEIVAYSNVMYAAILSCALTACIAFLSDLMITVRQMVWNLVGNLSACVASLPASVILINQFGMNGASFAISISYLIGSVIMFLRIGKQLKYRGSTRGAD